jgi:4-fold beta-flower domain-containing protein
MEPIYDRIGRAAAWRHDNDIYNLDGSHAAVLNGPNVYGHRGQQLGVFGNGLFRDGRGGVVAFMRGATGGPVLPELSVAPVPPVPSVPPVPAVPSVALVPAVLSSGWGVHWQEFINE